MSDDQVHAAFDAAESVSMPDEMASHDLPPAPPVDEVEPSPEAIGSRFPLNDFGNGQRLMHYSGEDLLFVPRLGWFNWTGQRWFADEDEIKARKLAQQLGDKIEAEIWQLEISEADRKLIADAKQAESDLEICLSKSEIDEDDRARLQRVLKRAENPRKSLSERRKAHRAHARASGNSNRIGNAMTEASVAAAIEVGALNADHLMLNTQTDTLEFKKSINEHDAAWGDDKPKWQLNVLDHDRGHYISKMCPVDYDPKAKCPIWIDFVERIQPNADVRNFLQRWFGLNLLGLTVDQKLVFLYGGGSNGKSTMVEMIAKIVGDYGTTLPIESLTGTEQRKGSDATPDLVRLPGARMVRASEPEQGKQMKEGLVKALTGGESILIRRMAKEFVEITPEFKLTISGNHKPEIRGGDDGIWRRVSLVPFDVQFKDDEKDLDLPRKLWDERSGVLNWLVAGALDYLQNGLQEPAIVLAATEEYRINSDPLREFLNEECELTDDPADWVRARDLNTAFNAWIFARGEGVWGKRHTANQIKKRAENYKDASGRTFGIMKRSDSGYCRIKLSAAAQQRVDSGDLAFANAVAKKG